VVESWFRELCCYTVSRVPVGTCIRRTPGRAGDELRERPDTLQGPEVARRGRDTAAVLLVVSRARKFRVNPDFGQAGIYPCDWEKA
jgi:hypothetical protein